MDLDKKFEMMSRECANKMNGTRPPAKKKSAPKKKGVSKKKK